MNKEPCRLCCWGQNDNTSKACKRCGWYAKLTETKTMDWEKEFVEKGAELEHIRWAKWQKYMYSKCLKDGQPGLIIPQDLVERWQIQIDTPYSELSETEKESDRKEVRTYLPLIRTLLAQTRQEVLREVRDKLPKVIYPTVEPPPNSLSDNQIFAGGQANMLLRTQELIQNLETPIVETEGQK